MGLSQAIRAAFDRADRYAVESMKAGVGWPNTGWAPPTGYVTPSTSGVVITDERARTIPAWHAGVRVISEDVAGLPLILYRRNGRAKDRAEDHPLYRLLHDAPNPDMTSFVFRETLQSHLLSWGNAYAEKEVNASGRVLALWPLRPDRMEPTWERGHRVYLYRLTDYGEPVRLSADRVFHIPGLGFDGLQGYSVLRMARETLGQSLALREYGARVLANDARPSTVLKFPGKLSDPAKLALRKGWTDAFGGFSNAGRTAVLEEGMDLATFGFPPEDVQFLESQKWQVNEVARWLRLAPHKIGDLERATFSNIEESNIDHVGSTLRAWLVRWEQQLNKDVVRDPSLFVEHLLDGLLRGKTLERYQALALGIQNKALTPNEWRAIENMNPVEWGDEPVMTPNNSAASPPLSGGNPA